MRNNNTLEKRLSCSRQIEADDGYGVNNNGKTLKLPVSDAVNQAWLGAEINNREPGPGIRVAVSMEIQKQREFTHATRVAIRI
ncbi:MAG: hypothetical protein KGK44_04555 [Gammaproteobacteria bacterium]|nr:hypothetical protein [Gammaproteobacteria bacterium]